MDEDASNLSSEMIEGSENTPPFCSPSLLSFNDHQNLDFLSENMSFTSSCEFSLQLDPNILEDLQTDSDATCMPDDSQSIEAPATSSEKQKHYSMEISQDLFANPKNSNEITQPVHIGTENTSQEEEKEEKEENADFSSSGSTISSFTSENVMTPWAQDSHLHKIERKLAWIKRKLNSTPTISTLRELKTCVGKIFGKLMALNEAQNVEKQQLSQSQGVGSRLAKRSTKLKKFIDISDKLDAVVSELMRKIEPGVSKNGKKGAETVENDENAAEMVENDENAAETIENDENAAEMVENDENAAETVEYDENAAETVEYDENAAETIENDENAAEMVENDENAAEMVENDGNAAEMVENDENVAAIASPRVIITASCTRVGYPGDLSPVLSVREDGTLYNKKGEEFSTISHWFHQQKGSQTVGQVLSGKSGPSSQRVKTIFDVLNFDKTSTLRSAQFKQTKVLSITNDDIIPQSHYLPQTFWSNDFSKILLNHALLQTIDQW